MTLSRDDTLAYLEGFELFLAGTLARQACGEHICFAKFDQTPNGSPEELVDDGVAEAAAVTGGWANQLARALEPAQTEQAILSVLDRFEQNGFRVEDFANVAAKKFLLGTLLGALDSQWEREHEEVLQPVKFAIGPVPLNITGSTFDQALKHWDKQQVLTRPAFDALAEGTKRRAFTVAGIAKNDMIDTVHAELRRQIAVGSATEGAGVSLREFHKFAKTRLESAGWTPSSPSHVETIFRTNIISAVSSGRYAEMHQPAVMAALPLWQILAVRDPRTRDTHKAANGVVLLATDPFWKHAYPPFGYNCRCKVCARTQAWLARASKSLGPTPRDLPDPGFDSGTKTLVQVPDAALKQTPAATPQAPVAPAQAPPGLGAPSPFPAMPPGFQLPTSAPEVPVAPSSAGLGAPSPFVPYTAPTEPVPLVGPEPITSGPTEHIIPPAPPASLLPPSPFPDRAPPITEADLEKTKKQYAAKSRAAVKFLDEQETAGVLRAYTGSQHEFMNQVLRGETRGRTAASVQSILASCENLSELLTKAEQAGKAIQGVVYRCVNASPELLNTLLTQPEIVFDGFTSTTVDPKIARSFSLGEHGNGRVLLRMRQRSAIPISKISNAPEEKEALLKAGTRFRVIGRRIEAPFHVIDLEQID